MSIGFLKFVALVCMILDHIGEFVPDSPIWFRYVGRLAAPIFFYCSAWGLYYTRNQRIYILRLYILSLMMSLGNIILTIIFNQKSFLTNNIFQTLFIGSVIVYLLNRKNTLYYKFSMCTLIIIQQVVAFLLCAVFAEFLQIPHSIDIFALYHSYGPLFASAIFTEGSVAFVIFFIVLYYLKDKKGYLSLFIIVFTIFLEMAIKRTYYMRGPMSYLIPFSLYQWLMIFCIPLIYVYNGKKGIGSKWFFYFFYPIHIWILYIFSNIRIQ